MNTTNSIYRRMPKPNTIELGTYAVESLPRGEYVRVPNKYRERVWVRGDYDRSSKRYSLTAWDDINREIFIKRGTMLEAGFTF